MIEQHPIKDLQFQLLEQSTLHPQTQDQIEAYNQYVLLLELWKRHRAYDVETFLEEIEILFSEFSQTDQWNNGDGRIFIGGSEYIAAELLEAKEPVVEKLMNLRQVA